jgi:hypothetical protein
MFFLYFNNFHFFICLYTSHFVSNKNICPCKQGQNDSQQGKNISDIDMSRSIIDQNSFSDQYQGYPQNKKSCLSHPKMYWTKCKKYKQKQTNSNQNQVIQRSISLISTLNDYSILEKQISKIAEQSSRNQTNNYSFDNIFHTKTQKNKSKIHCNNLSYIFK